MLSVFMGVELLGCAINGLLGGCCYSSSSSESSYLLNESPGKAVTLT